MPDAVKKGSLNALFDFVVECVATAESLSTNDSISRSNSCRIPLAFTFSFPVKQTGLCSGTLLRWTKGYAISDGNQRDIVECLREALIRKGLHHFHVVALCNDTVGTLLSQEFYGHEADIGCILGTGTNSCYWRKSYNTSSDSDKEDETGSSLNGHEH